MATPTVAILLCTHFGADYLQEQLDSICRQTYSEVSLWISDDNSEDATLPILRSFKLRPGECRVSIGHGPGSGCTANFLSLICNPEIEGDYFAYADQDDIWEPDKLSRAVDALGAVPGEIPGLYCSRTRAITRDGEPAGMSPLFARTPGFANALLQNIGGGNTMVMNRAARDLLRAAGNLPVVSHDWWTYILVTGAGGTVIYDPEPSVLYRQHDANLVGSNAGWRARLGRWKMAVKNRSRDWNTINIAALQQVRALITPENRVVLDEFSRARDRWLLPRIWGIGKSGVYLQTRAGTLGLVVAALLKKI
jgi:glycosyltransferase involved in cell wall biosynthesis